MLGGSLKQLLIAAHRYELRVAASKKLHSRSLGLYTMILSILDVVFG